MSRRSDIAILCQLARELAAALELGRVPAPACERARELLERAEPLCRPGAEDDAPPAQVRRIGQGIDALLLVGTTQEPAAGGPRRPARPPGFLPATEGPPLAARALAHLEASQALAQRTRTMIERPVAAGAGGADRSPFAGAGVGKRVELELVRGDSEPPSGSRGRRITGARSR